MDWIEAIRNVWVCFVNIFSDYFTMGNIIGLIAIFIAISTLNFSKRSFIVKDSYDPLLRILEENRGIGLYNTAKYNIDFLIQLKESYIYSAFEKREKVLINKIIENATLINQFKNNADKEAKKAAEEILLGELPKWKKDELDLIEVEVELTNELYSIIINGTLDIAYDMRDLEIICWLGEKYKTIRNEEIGEEIFYEKSKGIPLAYYLQKTIDKSELPEEISHLDVSTFFLSSVKEKIRDEYKKNVEFNIISIKSDDLTKDINKLIYILNESVKKLLIPNYTFNKYINSLLFWKRNKK
ncbi:hypothetical protein HNQ35_001443 [Cerasibacillus quisquiliarum]|uniref:Uncharacterized protein n=1 Tax=Cerasibacillus quisquiliarum TaxID=227865 RepID=A0A511UYY4_9BACI|nr:hypothetical protein [Cerasibacillus quisquiliarum]MBB5146242.1 hypothetical protein [Cerasibacillus quisquiliarum]GEN30978.1 hypothetical protein CQU01_12160 [Cerasibacillus quisquiliarum]